MNVRQIILVTSVLILLALAFLYSPPQPSEGTSVIAGNIRVVDSTGAPLPVVITSHGQSERSSRVNWIANAPRISVRLDALEAKSVGAEFRINSDSPSASVVLENYSVNPESHSPPGTPVRFVSVSETGISYDTVLISIAYNDSEVFSSEENLLIYHFKNGAWQPLPTTVDTEANIATAVTDSLSTFALTLQTSVQFNATLLVYNTQGNTNPSDDTLVLSTTLSGLPANGTTHEFGYIGSLYANQTYVVELRLRPNASYPLDADYFDETILRAGYPFSTWDNTSRREYIVSTTLVTNDSTRGEDIFVNQSSGVDYSVDSNAGETGMIQGDPDVVAIEKTTNNVYWFENGNSWNSTQIGTLASNVRSLALGDLERDGDVDVAVGTDSSFYIYENPSWTSLSTSASGKVKALAVADLDSDGYPDIITSEDGDTDSVVVYQNDGTPFNNTWSSSTVEGGLSSKVEDVATGDIDGDGDPDIVAGSGVSVHWYSNPGNPFTGSWTRYDIDTTPSGSIKSVSLGDLDGDGDLDVVVTTKNDDVVIYENDGTPTSWGGTSHTVKSNAGGDVEDGVVADLDGDEVPDIAVVVKVARDVLWFKNDGTPFDGGWSEYAVDSNTGSDPKRITAGDFDSDGDSDLAVGVKGGDVVWYENWNPTSQAWTPHTIAALSDEPKGVAVADLDGDANHNVLDYYASSSENVEEGADEFTGWDSLSGSQNYSFYFTVTPDGSWNNTGDTLSFYLGNESNTGIPGLYSAIRYPFKLRWTWNIGAPQTNVTLNATILDESGLLNAASSLYQEDGATLVNTTVGSSFNFTGKTRYYVEVDARESKNISARFHVNGGWSDAAVMLEKYASNPHSASPPGTPVKYVNVSATGASYSGVNVTVSYKDSEVEVNNVVEDVQLYQYNGTAWNRLTTTGTLGNRTAGITGFNTIALVRGAPTASSNDLWKMSFNTLPHSYKSEDLWYPEVKLYWQNKSIARNQAVYYQAYSVEDNSLLASGIASETTAGEYYFTLNATGHAGEYIRVRFNTSVGASTMREERVVFVGDGAQARGLPWKLGWRNTSEKPTFDATRNVVVVVDLYADSEALLPGQSVNLTVRDSSGAVLVNKTMNDNEDGSYTYIIPANTLSNGDDYHFQVYTFLQNSKTNNNPIYVYSDRYREAIAGGDFNAPDVWDLQRSPEFPRHGDNVTITARALDDVSVDSVVVYYRVNEQSWQSVTMNSTTANTYSADIGSFYAEEKVEYYVKATDTSGNSRKSDTKDFFVEEAGGTPTTVYVYLDQDVYYFASKSGSWTDATGVSGHDSDGVIFPDAARAQYDLTWRQEIMELNTIRAFALVLDERGRPLPGLTGVRFWLTNDTGYNLSKNGTDIGNGRYAAVFYGSKDENGNFTADDIGGPTDTSTDGNAMWGKFTSRRNYYLNVSIDGDLTPEAQTTWMAYTWLDTFFGQSMAGKSASHCEGNGCGTTESAHRDNHYDTSGERQDRYDNPSCQDCHGWSEGYTGSLGQGTDGTPFPGLNWGAVHPYQNESEAPDCTDSNCHGETWYASNQSIPPEMPVPGYADGTYNITDESYSPAPCLNCHNYSEGVQPTSRGHNEAVGCKFCHSSFHNTNKNADYNATNFTGTPGYAEIYAGDCYKDCHTIQEKHNGTVHCVECHPTFDTSPQHQPEVEPMTETCAYCHQNTSYEYAGARPPQIPVINHTTSSDGIWSTAMGYPTRYWYTQEYSCRYCHGRTFNLEEALGRVAGFKGNNTPNQSIGGGTWCAGCHYQGYVSGNKTYDDMIAEYNTSLGRVPPEITGNTSYAPATSPQNRSYVNHSIYDISSNYTDARCKVCHGAHLTAFTINAFTHNVSFDLDLPTANITQTPVDVKNNTIGSITVNATLSDTGSGVNTSVNPHFWYRINETGSESWTYNGEMSYLSGTNWSGIIPDLNWSSQLNKTLEYYLSNMTDLYGNTGNSSTISDFIQDHNNQPPSVPALLSPLGGESLSGTVTIRWENSTDDGRTPFTVSYDADYLYNGEWNDISQPASNNTSWNTTTLSDGIYKTRVRAYDGAEYSNFNVSDNFTLDNTPPTAVFTQTPSNVTDVSYGSVNISVTLSDALSGVDTTATPRLWYLLDNGTTTQYTDGGLMTYVSGTTWNASIPDPGWHSKSGYTLKYYVSGMHDNAGSSGNSTVQGDYIDPVESPSKTPATLRIATNRFVILDDPNSGQAAGGFNTPPRNWGSDYWSGESTTIRVYAVVLDGTGHAMTGKNITVTVKYPDGSNLTTLTAQTDTAGVANTSYDLNGRNFYGNYSVESVVEDSNLSAETTFIYNWWGCALCHNKEDPSKGGATTANSPYTNGWDVIVNKKRDHYQHTSKGFPDNNCTHCHQSYDGLPGGSTSATFNNTPKGFHTTVQCSNSTCHDTYTTHRSDMDIGSCNNCHSRAELSNKTTLDSSNRSTYSDTSPASGTPLKYHDADATKPCILCHNPMHNITTPYPQGRGNTVTESEHCLTCHRLSKHNNTVECTTCHTQDAHAVKYFTADGSNTTVRANAGGCDVCHINNTLDSRFTLPPPKVSAVLNHSNTAGAGKLWGSYWTNQSSACIYCHSDTKHKTSALGRPAKWQGDNTVNQSISGGTWCAGCHYQSYTSGTHTYTNMTTAFLGAGLNVPPAITPGTYYPSGSPYNHSGISGFTDDVCYTCHNGTSNYNYITQFTHNTIRGLGGGADCVGCHDLGGSAPAHVDAATMKTSVHANLNNNTANTTELTDPIDKACWACHGDGSEPGEHPDNYKSPRSCEYCHTSGRYNATVVSEHIPVENANIKTTAYCSTCHNNSINSFNNPDSRTTSANETTAHYATTTDLVNSISGPEGCVYCHENSTAAALWGNAGDPRNSTLRTHTETENRLCYTCHFDNATIPASFHNNTLLKNHTKTTPQNVTGNPVLNVTVNRWVILDDPNSGSAGSGFSNPPRNWGSDYWSGESTTIRMYALTMNNTGKAVSTQITFTLTNPGGTTVYQNTVSSSSEGIAEDSYNVNAQNYYGYWTVTATATIDGVALNKSTRFTYEWWGCASCHNKEDPSKSGTTTASSPYLHGYDPIISKKTQHETTCTYCHRGYTPTGEHTGKACTDCHSSITAHKTDQTIPDCYGCHPQNNYNLTQNNTLIGDSSVYSYNTTGILKAHTPNDTIPCIICHNPMHNITKPYQSTGNSYTETEQCITCHLDRRHSTGSPVNCTLCHSEDAHVIKHISNTTNATTANYTRIPQGTVCRDCHSEGGLRDYIVNSGYNPAKNDTRGYNITEHAGTINCRACHDNLHWIGYLNRTGRYQTANSTQVVDCLTCHRGNNSAVNSIIAYWGYLAPIKNRHNGTVFCEICHNYSKHGARYLNQQFNGFTENTSLAVNCTSCHQDGYNGAPQIHEPLNHSDNATAGQRWGDYWNSEAGACEYCHRDTKHNATALGRITEFRGDNTIENSTGWNTPIGDGRGNRSSYSIDAGAESNLSQLDEVGYSASARRSGLLGSFRYDWGGTPETTVRYESDGDLMYRFGWLNKSAMYKLNVTYYQKASGWFGNDTTPTVVMSVYLNNSTTQSQFMEDVTVSYDTLVHAEYNVSSSLIELSGGNYEFRLLLRNNNATQNTPFLSEVTLYESNDGGASWHVAVGDGTGDNTSYSIDAGAVGEERYLYASNRSGLLGSDSYDWGGTPETRVRVESDGDLVYRFGWLNPDVRYKSNVTYYQKAAWWFGEATPTVVMQAYAVNSTHKVLLGNVTLPYDTVVHAEYTIPEGMIEKPAGEDNYEFRFRLENNNPDQQVPFLSEIRLLEQGISNRSTWCTSCHYQGYDNGTASYATMLAAFTFDSENIPPEITGNTSYAPTDKAYYYNHTSIDKNDYSCRACHGTTSTTNITEFVHNVTSADGGPDCITCHDIGGSAPYHVNVSAMNSSDAIHKNLNKNATTSLDFNNKRCWACHGDGSEPSRHPQNYKTPYNCTDCHVSSNASFTPQTALPVREHYWNGSNITTPQITSCYACHNRSEMIIPADDPDTGTVYNGTHGGDDSPSHYGKKNTYLETLVNTSGYCMYCHINTSTIFPVSNTSISNHTSTGTPGCNNATCHVGGRIHNESLNKTVRCIECHTKQMSELQTGYDLGEAVTGSNMTHKMDTYVSTSGSDPDLNGTDTGKMYAKHANPNSTGGYTGAEGSARDGNDICLACHAAAVRSLGEWRSENWDSTGGKCGICHNIWTSYTPDAHNLSIPKCTDCHTMVTPTGSNHIYDGDPPKRYSNMPVIGRTLNTSRHMRLVLNTSLGNPTNDTGCLICHTSVSFTINYTSDPLNITITNHNGSHTWKSKPVCTSQCHPTNSAGKGPTPTDHDILNIDENNNTNCLNCHNNGTTLTDNEFINGSFHEHNINTPTCTQCHYNYTTMKNLNSNTKYVNGTMYNISVHYGLNCTQCHTEGHPPPQSKRKACEDCHVYQSDPVNDKDRHNITDNPSNYTISGIPVTNITDCTTCHDTTNYNNATTTYAYNKTRNCNYCHTYPDKTYT